MFLGVGCLGQHLGTCYQTLFGFSGEFKLIWTTHIFIHYIWLMRCWKRSVSLYLSLPPGSGSKLGPWPWVGPRALLVSREPSGPGQDAIWAACSVCMDCMHKARQPDPLSPCGRQKRCHAGEFSSFL